MDRPSNSPDLSALPQKAVETKKLQDHTIAVITLKASGRCQEKT